MTGSSEHGSGEGDDPDDSHVALVEQMAANSPRNVAVRGPDGTVTYGELSVRAERLARRLRQLGVEPGDLIGLCLDRSASLVVAAGDHRGPLRVCCDRPGLPR